MLITFALLTIYRLAAQVPAPGVNRLFLSQLFEQGGSGQPELFASLIRTLDGRSDLQPVVAHTRILTPDQPPPVGDHVLLRRLVLAEEVVRRVVLSIIHGGHGTVYTQA